MMKLQSTENKDDLMATHVISRITDAVMENTPKKKCYIIKERIGIAAGSVISIVSIICGANGWLVASIISVSVLLISLGLHWAYQRRIDAVESKEKECLENLPKDIDKLNESISSLTCEKEKLVLQNEYLLGLWTETSALSQAVQRVNTSPRSADCQKRSPCRGTFLV